MDASNVNSFTIQVMFCYLHELLECDVAYTISAKRVQLMSRIGVHFKYILISIELFFFEILLETCFILQHVLSSFPN